MQKEYPRPELVRENWIDLNGEWDFAFDFADTLVQQHPLTSDKHDDLCNRKGFPVAYSCTVLSRKQVVRHRL